MKKNILAAGCVLAIFMALVPVCLGVAHYPILATQICAGVAAGFLLVGLFLFIRDYIV